MKGEKHSCVQFRVWGWYMFAFCRCSRSWKAVDNLTRPQRICWTYVLHIVIVYEQIFDMLRNFMFPRNSTARLTMMQFYRIHRDIEIQNFVRSIGEKSHIVVFELLLLWLTTIKTVYVGLVYFWYRIGFKQILIITPTDENNSIHDDVIKWKYFPRYWPFVRGIHRHRWIPLTKASDAELWFFTYAGLNTWVNNREAYDLFETPSRPLWNHCNDVDILSGPYIAEQNRSTVKRKGLGYKKHGFG